MATDSKKYLEYLDKEMTIMGILSAVSIAAPAGILNALLTDDKGSLKERLLGAGPFFIIAGSVSCIIAALCFYGLRSRLAWYYGQMCLTESLDGSMSSTAQLRNYMRGADSWETWIRYNWGLTALVTGFVEYVSATLFVLARTNSRLSLSATIVGRFFPLFAIGLGFLERYVWKRYSFRDEPWADFWSDIRHLIKTELPHEGVYTRLKTSPISGVGVFAIRDIPNGTYIFEPDDEALASVRKSKTENLAPAVRQLYKDFCVLRGDRYQCPSNFNKLTPSWYLNASEYPNVAADLSLKFYALRDIPGGEELTTDYSSYSDNGVLDLSEAPKAEE